MNIQCGNNFIEIPMGRPRGVKTITPKRISSKLRCFRPWLHNRRYVIFCYFFIFFSLIGCFFPGMWKNPGYRVNLNINKCHLLDIRLIENFLKEMGYNLDAINHDENRHIVQFSKNIVADISLKNSKVIVIMLQEKTSNNSCKHFIVSVENWYHGDVPLIRDEIDKTGNALRAEISFIVGEENVELTRKATGPPF